MAVSTQSMPATEDSKTFVRVAEVWVPDRERRCLEFGGGAYGDAWRFGSVSRNQVFGRGEGLPGRVWARGEPEVLNEFSHAMLRRTQSAHAAGLTSAIALPVYVGEFVTAVLVLFCGADDAHAGAVELWRARAGDIEMQWVDGYYGTTEEAFRFTSTHTSFRRGVGLPGLAWEADRPYFMEDLGHSGSFLRAAAARRVGIDRGLAVPCPTRRGDYFVLSFLSALGTPIARRCEIWTPDDSRSQLLRTDGFCERQGRLEQTVTVERGEGALGSVWTTGVPRVSERAAAELAGYSVEITAAGLQSIVAVPLTRDGLLVSVVALYF